MDEKKDCMMMFRRLENWVMLIQHFLIRAFSLDDAVVCICVCVCRWDEMNDEHFVIQPNLLIRTYFFRIGKLFVSTSISHDSLIY